MLDDEPHVLSALRRTLRLPLGDDVTMELFTCPHEALQRMGTQSFDLIMSDFRMPAMNGIQFLRFARELQPDAVRIIVSASTEIDGVMSAINEVGVFRYIVKPWTAEVLIDDVRAALAQATLGREERRLAAAMRVKTDGQNPDADELRRLEDLEPGLTQVDWGPNGEVIMPTIPARLT